MKKEDKIPLPVFDMAIKIKRTICAPVILNYE